MEVMFYDQVRASKWLPYASTCSLTLLTQRCLETGISHGHGHRGSERVNRLSKGVCVQETHLLTHPSSSAVQKREAWICVCKFFADYTIHIGDCPLVESCCITNSKCDKICYYNIITIANMDKIWVSSMQIWLVSQNQMLWWTAMMMTWWTDAWHLSEQ